MGKLRKDLLAACFLAPSQDGKSAITRNRHRSPRLAAASLAPSLRVSQFVSLSMSPVPKSAETCPGAKDKAKTEASQAGDDSRMSLWRYLEIVTDVSSVEFADLMHVFICFYMFLYVFICFLFWPPGPTASKATQRLRWQVVPWR